MLQGMVKLTSSLQEAGAIVELEQVIACRENAVVAGRTGRLEDMPCESLPLAAGDEAIASIAPQQEPMRTRL